MTSFMRLLTLLALASFVAVGCDRATPDGHAETEAVDPHAGHDHGPEADAQEEAAPAEPQAIDPHAGHDHGPEADAHEEDARVEAVAIDPHAGDDPAAEDDAHAGEAVVHLTMEQQAAIGLSRATAGPGTIGQTAAFPGEVVLNPDRMAHIVPRAAGIVRAADKALGERVEAGEILAWIESDELAEAKLAFYAALTEVGCCQIELPRAKDIFENTNRLLTALEQDHCTEELEKLEGREMGEYRGKLITAYFKYDGAKKTYERERDLYSRNISSEQVFIEAEAAMKKAQAEYVAARDTARYQVLIDYNEAVQKRQVAEFQAVAAENRLRLKGVGDEDLARLIALVPQTSTLEPCLCDDPNCKEDEIPSVLETLGSEPRLGWYPLRAPFSGYITEKHLTLGEMVDGAASVLAVADTSSVWVRFNVYQNDLALVRVGQRVRVEAGGDVPPVTGTVAYLAPIVDRETRTAAARVELANGDGKLRPGLYATVHLSVDEIPSPVVISREAVQVLDDEAVVFVVEGDGFAPIPVHLGQGDRDRVAVLSGLKPGQVYVEHGAFELKARMVTTGIDPHAGHGH